MFHLIRSRLEIKILLLLSVVLIIGFGTTVILSLQRESEGLLKQQREKLHVATESVSAGIRNVMLTGKSPFAVAMLNDVRQNLTFIDITVFDRFGKEVFFRSGEGIGDVTDDATVLGAIRESATMRMEMNAGERMMSVRTDALFNRVECQRCHDPKERLRGALQVGFKPEVVHSFARTGKESSVARELGKVIAAAFRAIMVGGNGEHVDTLMVAAERIPGVRRAQVYDRFGGIYFGPEDPVLDDAYVEQLLEERVGGVAVVERRGSFEVSIPLANEERCQVCHGSKHGTRGVLVVTVDRQELMRSAGGSADGVSDVFHAAVKEGFRSLMLVGRAGSVRSFIEELRVVEPIQRVNVYDVNARERFLDPAPRERAGLAGVIANLDTIEVIETSETDERLVRVIPIMNERRCYSCHGSKHTVRAAIEVSTSMTEVNARIRTNTTRSVIVGVLTIGLLWLVLRTFMRRFVVSPIQKMEVMANRVGKGDLSVRTEYRSEDELGSLSLNLNEMVRGLRQRLKLEKFVSQQTIAAVRVSDDSEIMLGGVRKTATVLFTDIRGFTSYSERTDPEKVVSMLNEILTAQSVIVRKYGGDIDKYVGDELIAVFEGEGMVDRAVRAAVEIQEGLRHQIAVDGGETIYIGVGINTGEMVMGAMGSPERMDHTVIGDAVNLGARLCSAAEGGAILLSGAAFAAFDSPDAFRTHRRNPLNVKGKKEPVDVYEVLLSGEERSGRTQKKRTSRTTPGRRRGRQSRRNRK